MEQRNKKKMEDRILTIPNVLTIIRIAGTAGLLTYMMKEGVDNRLLVTGAALAIAATDTLDGQIARRCHMESRFGGLIDPIADKLFAYGLVGVLMVKEAMPAWPLLIAVRDVIVWSFTSYHYFKTGVELRPTMPAKLKMVLETAGIVSTLAFGFGTSGLSLLGPIFWGGALATPFFEIGAIQKVLQNESLEEEKVKVKTLMK